MQFLVTATRSKNKTSKKFKPSVSKFFKDQTDRIMFRFNEYFGLKRVKQINESDIEIIVDILIPKEVEDAILKEAMNPMHVSAVQKAVNDINSLGTGIQVNASLTNPNVVLGIGNLASRVTRVNDGTREMLASVIQDGVNDGLDVVTIAENIRKAGIDEWYKNRALTIARTETRLGYSSGTSISFKELNVETFDVVGCIGTLAGSNELGLTASYGDFSEEIGSCGVTNVDGKLIDAVVSLHHPNHAGVEVPTNPL